MPISLYDAAIPSMIQLLGAGQTWLEKAAGSGIPEQEIVEARLREDMLPFAYQVKSMVVHSVGAIEGIRKGAFSPDMEPAPGTLEELRLMLGAAENVLIALSQGELESFIGEDMRFEIRGRTLPFTADQFLLSFSQPNFYFHASTAYGILRVKGVDVGKRDFLGQMRLRQD